jgi:ferredoxin--NADP+ reductase
MAMSAAGATKETHLVIVVGAGPAGMAVANKMADAGHDVIILNRDIKLADWRNMASFHQN